MPPDRVDSQLAPGMARFVASHIGLHYPPEREADLLRGLRGAATDAGFDNVIQYSDWLLSTPPLAATLRQLATHLTIGETYFFREEQALRALSEQVLPKLVAGRRGVDQHLRLWSAACSTGEEAYSLAILLRELLPDWSDWRITLLATDINPQSLQKAVDGVYGEWSFRTLPASLRARYFTPSGDRRFAINEAIRSRVTFVEANLAADNAAAWPAEAVNMDVILCRNLLIYFTAEQGQKLVARLHDALIPGGFLVVSPSELSQHVFSRFVPMNFPGTILYRRALPDETSATKEPATAARRLAVAPVRTSPPHPAPSTARRSAAIARNRPIPPTDVPSSPIKEDLASLAKALANQGKLREALTRCDQWINADKMDPAAHYFHATVRQELGERDSARQSLQRCLYLQPEFALAHLALGNLARSDGRDAESQRHYRNAQRILDAQPRDAVLPESEGLTAGRVAAIVRSLLEPDDSDVAPAGHQHAVR